MQPFLTRNKNFESHTVKILNHLNAMLWQDICLKTVTLLTTEPDVLSLKTLNGKFKKNALDLNQLSLMPFKMEDEIYQKIKNFRNKEFGHNMVSIERIKINLEDVEVLFNQILPIYNSRAFVVDLNDYELTSNDIQKIEVNAKSGLHGLFKRSEFLNFS